MEVNSAYYSFLHEKKKWSWRRGMMNMLADALNKSRSPRAKDLILTADCPNSYYTYPRLTEIEKISPALRAMLDQLWKRSVHQGHDVKIYRFTDVFVVKEGLVFDESGALIDCTRTYHADEEIAEARRLIDAVKAGSRPKQIARGILAKSRGAENYGHFLVEMLPRAWLARRKLGLAEWPAVIYDRPHGVQAKAVEALALAGFERDRVLSAGPEPVFFRELIFVDGLSYHTQYLSPFVMQCLDAVSDTIAAGTAKHLYVPRRPATTRDFAAEPEIASRLHDLGFHEAETAALSFADQVAAFKGADAVVGVMGAALTNIVFCRPGTAVTMFTPSTAAEVFFWMLSAARRLNYHEIRCPEVGPQIGPLPWDRLIEVSPDHLQRIVTATA